jgi:hypothetical protein
MIRLLSHHPFVRRCRVDLRIHFWRRSRDWRGHRRGWFFNHKLDLDGRERLQPRVVRAKVSSCFPRAQSVASQFPLSAGVPEQIPNTS